MLYITTRGDRDAFTAHRTLCTDRAPDHGCFIPMRFPKFSEKEINDISLLSFEETVAYILNLFFSSGLSKWDVSLCVGRNTARIHEMNTRIIFAELWHNPENSFQHAATGLFQRISGEHAETVPTEWFSIAVKIAVLFGIYGTLCNNKLLSCGETIDLSLPADDFSYPMAAIYAISIGLPLGTVICNCTQTREIWNLIHRGSYNISGVPDVAKAGIERFLSLRLNKNPMSQKSYEAEEYEKDVLRSGLFCIVSSKERVLHELNGVYSNMSKILTPDAALCLSGLSDYRARTGDCRLTLILEEDSPALFANR